MTTMTQNQTMRDNSWLLTELPESVIEHDAARMPKWLADIRRSAFRQFTADGLPSAKQEKWRQINLRPIRETAFGLPADGATDVSEAEVVGHSLPFVDAVRLVFVNGRYAAELSDARAMPSGVTVQTIREALKSESTILETHLTKYVNADDDPFVSLNTALLDDGVVVHIEKNITCDTPIYLLCITTAADGPIITHPRNLIIAEDGAQATIVEDYVGTDGEVYLTNAVTELVVGEDAHLHHYLLERESDAAFNVSTLTAYHKTSSTLSSHTVLLGGALVRNNVNPIIDGEHCHSLLNGLYIGRGKQHIDNLMRVEHRKPNCESRQFYKGILTDESRGVFAGRIIVSRDAQKIDAVQSNQSLLLSEAARANSMPQLEIYADDVKCTHGATIGELDEEALFYLESRGLAEPQAKAMLVHAFAGESLERMNLPVVQEALLQMLTQRLPFTSAANV